MCHLSDPEATERFGRALALCLRPGKLITLQGPLGSGKTALVRAILHGLGHQGRVRSPTYTLVEEYDLPFGAIRHFDFYRFASSGEADDAGFREHFDGTALCLVEWPEQAGDWLPSPDLVLRFVPVPVGRSLLLEPRGVLLPPDLPGCAP
jgi:tRNA threonylcarbamoyladenosine biosynthesis protein TsaE